MNPADEHVPDNPIWKSYIWHYAKCYFVSTIERTFNTSQGSVRGQETIVWEYDWDKGERGKMIHQSGGVSDHQRVCSLIADGKPLDETTDD